MWQGCGGGVEDDAFNYVQQNKGISPLSLYPYIAGVRGYLPIRQDSFRQDSFRHNT